MRVLGLVLVFSVPFFVGLWASARARRSLVLEREWVQLSKEIYDRIRYSVCPAAQLLNGLSLPGLTSSGWLPAFAVALGRGADPVAVWEQYRQLTLPSPSTDAAWLWFLRRLGRVGLEDQLLDCRRLWESLESALPAVSQRLQQQAKLYLTLGAVVGALAVLILL